MMVLGVAAFLTCGGLPSPGSVPLRTSYGPAVFGRGGIFGAVLVLGLTGAPDKPPTFGRVALVDAAVRPDALEAPDAVRMFRGGENSIAEPGLGRDASIAEPGLDIAARWALIVSLIEGLVPIVLRENPMPGRAGPVASVRLGVFGLLGSFSNSFWAVGSKVSMSLKVALVMSAILPFLQRILTHQLLQAKYGETPKTCPSSSPSHPDWHPPNPS